MLENGENGGFNYDIHILCQGITETIPCIRVESEFWYEGTPVNNWMNLFNPKYTSEGIS